MDCYISSVTSGAGPRGLPNTLSGKYGSQSPIQRPMIVWRERATVFSCRSSRSVQSPLFHACPSPTISTVQILLGPDIAGAHDIQPGGWEIWSRCRVDSILPIIHNSKIGQTRKIRSSHTRSLASRLRSRWSQFTVLVDGLRHRR